MQSWSVEQVHKTAAMLTLGLQITFINSQCSRASSCVQLCIFRLWKCSMRKTYFLLDTTQSNDTFLLLTLCYVNIYRINEIEKATDHSPFVACREMRKMCVVNLNHIPAGAKIILSYFICRCFGHRASWVHFPFTFPFCNMLTIRLYISKLYMHYILIIIALNTCISFIDHCASLLTDYSRNLHSSLSALSKYTGKFHPVKKEFNLSWFSVHLNEHSSLIRPTSENLSHIFRKMLKQTDKKPNVKSKNGHYA